MSTARTEVSYLDLAKAARATGNNRMFWLIFKQHARVKRKERQLREQRDAHMKYPRTP